MKEISNTCHSIRNRCEIIAFIIDHGCDAFSQTVLPTLLEDNCQNAQDLALNFCVEREIDIELEPS